MTSSKNSILVSETTNILQPSWNGPEDSISFDENDIKAKLKNLEQPCFVLKNGDNIGASNSGELGQPSTDTDIKTLGYVPALPAENLGDPEFKSFHNTRYAFYAGSMANGISSAKMVIALGKHGFMASFGAGGVIPSELKTAIQQIQNELPKGPYAFNLIHNPFQEAMERNAVDLYLKHNVTTVEASAYMELTPYVVYYRVAGLSLDSNQRIQIKNKIIAKISRREVATKFMEPAPDKFLKQLLEQGLITEIQAKLAKQVPLADDVTVEADSGGHTDNRPLVSILPSMIALRNEIQEKFQYERPPRIGAAGGIGTPESALAAFMMGAAYVVTGSVNQACIEAGSSEHVKNLLTSVQMADVTMAPAMDMFEMGGKLQVTKRGTLFAMRAQKLADLFRTCKTIEDIPDDEKEKLEKQVFQRTIDSVWQETIEYFNQRDPEQIHKANKNPRKKMALVFRWYLGLASHWANTGEKGREMDYQIWCGPSMGAFNDWVKGSYLEHSKDRSVVDITRHILTGAAYLYRLQHLRLQQIGFPFHFSQYIPQR